MSVKQLLWLLGATAITVATVVVVWSSNHSTMAPRAQISNLQPATSGDKDMQPTNSLVSLTAHAAGRRSAKPPLSYLLFDVTIENKDNQSQWLLLPQRIDEPPISHGGVDGVESFQLTGSGTVWLNHFHGDGGFYAVHLAPNSHVVLRQLPIAQWGPLASPTVGLSIIATKSLLIGDVDAQLWIRNDVLSTSKADGMLPRGGPQHTRYTPDRGELLCATPMAQRLVVPVDIPSDLPSTP